MWCKARLQGILLQRGNPQELQEVNAVMAHYVAGDVASTGVHDVVDDVASMDCFIFGH